MNCVGNSGPQCLCRGIVVPKRRRSTAPAQAISGWPDTAMEKAIHLLQHLRLLGNAMLTYMYDQRHQLEKWYVKAAATALLILALVTAAANVWCVGSINRRYIPQACAQAEAVLERKVGLGRVKWVAPSGLVGLGPLAAIGPVDLGPGPAERSSAALQELIVRVDPVQSLVQGKLVLQLHADAAKVSLVQADNFSWFGYPDDTELSARNFFPGLAKGLESDIAQHVLPGALPGDEQDQPLAGNAARLSSKVAKAEARRGLPPAPDSAFNFRPAVGSDLELVSKDERELETSRAELQALILQQRSAQASSVESPPSTSSPSPPAAQHSEWHPRGHRSTHAPKQATRHNSPLHDSTGQESTDGAAAAAVGLSTSASGSSPFASITGRGSSPRRKSGRAAAEAAQSDAADGHSAPSSNGRAEHAKGEANTSGKRAYFGKGLSNGSASRGVEADVSSDEIHVEEDQNGWRLSVHQPDQQPGSDDLPARQRTLQGAIVGVQTASHTAGPEGEGMQGPVGDGKHIENGEVPTEHQSGSEEQAGSHRDAASDELLSSVSLEVSGTNQGMRQAGGPRAASRGGSVRCLRPKHALPPPLQVHKGRPHDAPQHATASSEAPTQGMGDSAAAAGDAKSSDAEQLAGASAAPADVSGQSDAATGADATAPDVSGNVGSGAPATDAPSSADDIMGLLPQLPDDSPSQGASLAESIVGIPTGALQPLQPTSHDVFSSLIRQRQERKAGKLRPSWSNQSWDARWYGGPEGHTHQHGGSRTPQQDWPRPQESLRRTTRSRLRHGRSTVQDPRQMEWSVQESLDRETAAAESVVPAGVSNLNTGPAVSDVEDEAQHHDAATESAAADGKIGSTIVEEAAQSEDRGAEEEDEAGPEQVTAADASCVEEAPQESIQKRLQWPWQGLSASHGASPLSGLRKRFLELFPPSGLGASVPEQQSVQSAPVDTEADQAPSYADVDSADAPLEPVVFAPGQDKLQHFSLHRSHSKMLLSTAETAAAMAEKEAAAEALLASNSKEGQAGIVAGEITAAAVEEAHRLDAQPEQQAAFGPMEEHAAHAAEKQDVEGPEQQQEEPAADNLEADVVSPEQEDMLEETTGRQDRTTAQEEVEVPAIAELMKVDTPSFSALEQSPQQEPASVEVEPTAADGQGTPEPSQAAEQPSESTDDEQPEPAHTAQLAPEAMQQHASVPAQEEAEPQEAPQETLLEQALTSSTEGPPTQGPPVLGPPTPEAAVQEAVPRLGEPAFPRASKPELNAAAAAAAAAPSAPESPTGSRASSKAKHSWQSPALSARYGEVEDNEPRYKPRNPSADASSTGGVRAWAAKRIGALVSSLKPPDVALAAVTLRGADLHATLTGESIPRHVQNIDLKLRFGRDYRSLTLDLTGVAHERDSASDKCTMINPLGQRHLRDVPSAPIVRSFSEVPQVAAATNQGPAACADRSTTGPEKSFSFSTGTRPSQWEEQLQDLAKERMGGVDGARSRSEADPDSPYGADITITEPAQKKKKSWLAGIGKSGPAAAKATGGRLRLRLNVKDLGDPERLADLDLMIWGDNLHAPLIERIVELPMDIYGGRVNGKLRIQSNDKETWKFPAIKGRVRGSDLAFHFFDAPDDFSRTRLDLLFEGDRLYFHGAQGFFGAVPITLNGDMDINPETGQYRLSASVPGVEANELRRTLAIRPMPFPIGGAVRGVLHCTGPLETPVFSGTAVAMPPSREDVEAMEDSNARETLREFPRAAGAYDRVPIANASAVWTLDTSTDIFLLHSIQAEPLGGGQVLGSGRMWVSPEGEMDPRAVRVQLEGQNLPTEALLNRYMPKATPLPAATELGDSSVQGTMAGSFLAPDLHMRWEAPAVAASGTADFSRDANRFTCRAPSLDVSGALFLRPPPFYAVKAVLTQAEATALAQPQLEGADIDCDFKGLDVLPIAAALERGSAAKAQRLKLNGRTKFSVRLTPTPDKDAGQSNGEHQQQAERRPSAFAGDLTLDGLRVNQLKLSRNLTGTVLLSEDRFQIRAKGQRPDETLDVNLKLPFAPGSSGTTKSVAPKQAAASATPASAAPSAGAGTGAALLGKRRAGLGALLPMPRFGGAAAPPALLPQPASAASDTPGAGGDNQQGGNFVLRCGQLLMSAEVNAKASRVECAVQGLLLDELELASLRGEVQEASLSLNLESRLGRAVVSVAGPRFSGLQGQSLSGAFRWERDVVRLERAVLQQANSRYEVQGEYVIPSSATIPRSAADMALVQGSAAAQDPNTTSLAPFETGGGRWRLQVSVPTANMEEILPAARLLSRATALSPSDYERAKTLFLSGVDASNLAAQELGRQLEAAAQAARMAMEADAAGGSAGAMQASSDAPDATRSNRSPASSGKSSATPRQPLPGLQDLRGQWSGGVQAYGGGGGATNVDFNVRGQDWQWGIYGLDQVVANGSCHSIEGIKLEELGLKTGEAKLLVRGSLLGAAQDASIILTDFPVAVLQPFFRALPALEHAMPAVAASGGPGSSSANGTLGGLAVPFLRGGHLRSSMHRSYSVGLANSPVNGLLYVRGTIGGSAAVPEGDVVVRLYDGAIGPTYLAQAQAQASLNTAQQLSFSADLAPAEAGRHSGHVRVSGNVPLRPAPALPARTGPGSSEELEVSVSVKDGGMMLVTALTPDLRWQSGAAELSMRVHGSPSHPQVEGRAHFAKAAIACPWLKYPMTNLGGTVRMADNALKIEGLEAHVGRRGRIRVKGGLPLTADGGIPPDAAAVQTAGSDAAKTAAAKDPSALIVDVHGLELRLRNVYTGYLDAGLKLQNSLTAPAIGGDVRLSRGVASLLPGGPSPPNSSGGGAASSGTGQQSGIGALLDSGRARETDLVFKAFTVLTGKDALARQLSRFDVQQAGEAAMQPVAQAVALKGLKIHLGPELRAMFPVVLNMSISGDIELNGAADPASLKLAGIIHLDGGEVNLVATQLVLDREHPNRLVFSPSRGLDPLLDLRLKGAQVQALIQGRASAWQQNLVLTPTKAGAGEAGGAGEAAEAARIFEGQLAGALVAEDGQLALSNLAASAAHGFMPKIQTQGQLGQARWRLVSAPSIPGLLSLDPSGDPTSLLSSLTMGTEVEVHFGRSLQAAMARKLRDSDIATQWTLNYQLNSKLRMQFNIASSSPYPRTLIFQYSSETTPPPLPR
ncbi:g5659 [Coccomyxa elongata]